jgi:hypothetical protein
MVDRHRSAFGFFLFLVGRMSWRGSMEADFLFQRETEIEIAAEEISSNGLDGVTKHDSRLQETPFEFRANLSDQLPSIAKTSVQSIGVRDFDSIFPAPETEW